MDLLRHPDELWAAIRFKYQDAFRSKRELHPTSFSPADAADLEWCYDMLPKVSRSFAMVIKELSEELRDSVCIFYLALRGLDTIEDDMSLDVDKKVELMKRFPACLRDSNQPLWNIRKETQFEAVGKGDEKVLLEDFHKAINIFQKLKPEYQDVIYDITDRMSKGMVDFITTTRVNTVEQYNLYCHYVAGLVGIGLSQMFASSKLEDPSFAQAEDLSNSMGLFLQKTNIIRDYLEDMIDGRIFWPKDIWSLYTDQLENFKSPEYVTSATQCLNHLVGNALTHATASLEYLEKLKEKNNFNFCAIPQVMAIATLAACYDNPNVFRTVVKMRRGTAVKMIIECKDGGMTAVYRIYHRYAIEILQKLEKTNLDPQKEKTRELLQGIIAQTSRRIGNNNVGDGLVRSWSLGVGFFASLAVAWYWMKIRHNQSRRLLRY